MRPPIKSNSSNREVLFTTTPLKAAIGAVTVTITEFHVEHCCRGDPVGKIGEVFGVTFDAVYENYWTSGECCGG